MKLASQRVCSSILLFGKRPLLALLLAGGVVAGLWWLQHRAGHAVHEELILGNPAILDELQTRLSAHGSSAAPLRTTTRWDAVRMPITTVRRRVRGDVLIGRSAEIAFRGTPQTALFVMRESGGLIHGQIYPRGTVLADVVAAPPPLDDTAAFTALFALQSHVINSLGYLSILKGAEFSKGVVADAQADITALSLYRHFAGAFLHFDGRRDVRMRAMVAEAKKYLLFTETEQTEVAGLIVKATRAMQRELDAFRWRGQPMTRAEFYDSVATLPDAASRRALVEQYSAAVLRAHRVGLFPMIARLNVIASTHGFANYAAYASQVIYQLPVDTFVATMDAFAAEHHGAIAQFIAQLGETVQEWDVAYLAKRGMTLPTLAFRDALNAAQAFYRDIGFDLDAAPFAGNILYDTNRRADKYGNAFAARLGDGSRTWFHANFAPDQPVTLDNLRTIVHELAHNIHRIIGAEGADGNGALGMAAQPLAWREGIARALDGLVTTHAWMDRYLSHLPQFADPAVRRRLADMYTDLNVYEQMLVFARARFELNLYDDLPAGRQGTNPDGSPRSLEERLDAWSALADRYLHVQTMPGQVGGVIWATPHFATSPCYYAAYSGGYPVAQRAVQPIVAGLLAGNIQHMQNGGKNLTALFRQGAALATLDEIETAVSGFRTALPR